MTRTTRAALGVEEGAKVWLTVAEGAITVPARRSTQDLDATPASDLG